MPEQPKGFVDMPSFVDLLQSNENRKKGVFLKSERFPKKSAPNYNVDNEVRPDWLSSDNLGSNSKLMR